MWLRDEENPEDWKDNITLLLGSKGLDSYIEQKATSDPSDPEPGETESKGDRAKDGSYVVWDIDTRINTRRASRSDQRREGPSGDDATS
jgi:hypothetical protein